MIFLGEPLVGRLDLLRGGVSGDAKDSIVVLEARQTVRTFREVYLSGPDTTVVLVLSSLVMNKVYPLPAFNFVC
jgi:hypothetical protein